MYFCHVLTVRRTKAPSQGDPTSLQNINMSFIYLYQRYRLTNIYLQQPGQENLYLFNIRLINTSIIQPFFLSHKFKQLYWESARTELCIMYVNWNNKGLRSVA
jgi:hypothetical protein